MNSYFENTTECALNYIRRNLSGNISLSRAAEAAGISVHHFYRIIHAYTGTSVQETIDKLRTEKAAGLLLSTSKTVREISDSCGFKDSHELNREIKKRLGVSPSAWRKEKNGGAPKKAEFNYKSDIGKGKIKPLSSEIIDLDDFTLAYIRHNDAYAGDSALFIYLYNKLTVWAASQDLSIAERSNFVIHHYPEVITEKAGIRISLGMSVPDDIETVGDIGIKKVPGGNYLVSRFSLQDEDYDTAWNHVYRSLLPENKLLPADSFGFELYPADVKSRDENETIVDLCVPVRTGKHN